MSLYVEKFNIDNQSKNKIDKRLIKKFAFTVCMTVSICYLSASSLCRVPFVQIIVPNIVSSTLNFRKDLSWILQSSKQRMLWKSSRVPVRTTPSRNKTWLGSSTFFLVRLFLPIILVAKQHIHLFFSFLQFLLCCSSGSQFCMTSIGLLVASIFSSRKLILLIQ